MSQQSRVHQLADQKMIINVNFGENFQKLFQQKIQYSIKVEVNQVLSYIFKLTYNFTNQAYKSIWDIKALWICSLNAIYAVFHCVSKCKSTSKVMHDGISPLITLITFLNNHS